MLLEPIHTVEIVCPSDATAKINAILSGRRGQILSFETREGWNGWDSVRAMMPEAEIGNLIVEVRSATAGAGTFTSRFDHMAEMTGRAADQAIASKPGGGGLEDRAWIVSCSRMTRGCEGIRRRRRCRTPVAPPYAAARPQENLRADQ